MAESAATAIEARRATRRAEWELQTTFANLIDQFLDRATTFATGLENKPISRISGVFQRRRGIRSGLADYLIVHRGRVIFIELKAPRGIASKAQKQVYAEVMAAGGRYWLARSTNAGLTALYRSRLPFRQPWKPPRLEAWEGPFADPTRRLPQHPLVAAERRQAARRRRERQQRRATPPPALEPRHEIVTAPAMNRDGMKVAIERKDET